VRDDVTEAKAAGQRRRERRLSAGERHFQPDGRRNGVRRRSVPAQGAGEPRGRAAVVPASPDRFGGATAVFDEGRPDVDARLAAGAGRPEALSQHALVQRGAHDDQDSVEARFPLGVDDRRLQAVPSMGQVHRYVQQLATPKIRSGCGGGVAQLLGRRSLAGGLDLW